MNICIYEDKCLMIRRILMFNYICVFNNIGNTRRILTGLHAVLCLSHAFLSQAVVKSYSGWVDFVHLYHFVFCRRNWKKWKHWNLFYCFYCPNQRENSTTWDQLSIDLAFPSPFLLSAASVYAKEMNSTQGPTQPRHSIRYEGYFWKIAFTKDILHLSLHYSMRLYLSIF